MELLEQLFCRERPGLLVSVRNANEALAALAGGADVIDVKEPERGPLGAADTRTIADVVRTVGGRAPVTAAAGELMDRLPELATGSIQTLPAGVSLVKLGLSRCGSMADWQLQWQRTFRALQNYRSRHALPVAVIYADWKAAATPRPELIHSAALDIGCRVVLIDTWDKSVGDLFDHTPLDELRAYVLHARQSGLSVVLAGSLSGAKLLAAAELRPRLIGVRSAACSAGRNSSVSQECVAGLRHLLTRRSETTNRRNAEIGMQPAHLPVRHEKFS